MFEIDRLCEIIDENKLNTQWINELGTVRDSIPANERKKRFLFLKGICSKGELRQPEDIDLFTRLERQYRAIEKLVYRDVEKRTFILENKEIPQRDEQLSFLETLEGCIIHSEDHIGFDNMMSLLDLSESKQFLKQYVNVLEHTVVDLYERRRFERVLYDGLVYSRDKVFSLIEQEVQKRKDYLEVRKGCLSDIERTYEESLEKTYKTFLGMIVPEMLVEFANSTIIEPWNRSYGNEVFLKRLTIRKETEGVSDVEIHVSSNDGQVSAGLDIDGSSSLIFENCLRQTEDRFREFSAERVKEFASHYLSMRLEEYLDIIRRKRDELLEHRQGLEEELEYWKQLKNEISGRITDKE